MDDEKITINQLKLEEEQALKDFSEIRRQHEEDQDKEIEDTKAKYSIRNIQEFKRFIWMFQEDYEMLLSYFLI